MSPSIATFFRGGSRHESDEISDFVSVLSAVGLIEADSVFSAVGLLDSGATFEIDVCSICSLLDSSLCSSFSSIFTGSGDASSEAKIVQNFNMYY